jgi:hypothetical protein
VEKADLPEQRLEATWNGAMGNNWEGHTQQQTRQGADQQVPMTVSYGWGDACGDPRGTTVGVRARLGSIDDGSTLTQEWSANTSMAPIDTGALVVQRTKETSRTRQDNRETMMRQVQEKLPGAQLVWSKTLMPTLAADSMPLLSALVDPAYKDAMLAPVAELTELEQADGPIVLMFKHGMPTIDELAQFFMHETVPAGKALTTRKNQNSMWRGYVTFALATDNIRTAFPIQRQMLAAFITCLMAFGYIGSTIANWLSVLNSRHRSYHAGHILQYKEATEWLKGLKKHLTAPTQQKLPIRLIHLTMVSELRDDTIRLAHDKFLLLLGTIGCMPPGELPLRDLCDWRLHNELDDSGAYLGAELNLSHQKNRSDPQSKRYAYGAPPGECVIEAGQAWLRMSRLVSNPRCQKWQSIETRNRECRLCGRLFRKFNCHWPQMKGPPAAHAMSKEAVTVAITSLLNRIGQETLTFSGKSMRRGGLTHAKRQGVHEELRRLQSGHKSAANRVYEHSSSSDEEEGAEQVTVMLKPKGGWTTPDLYLFSRAFHNEPNYTATRQPAGEPTATTTWA